MSEAARVRVREMWGEATGSEAVRSEAARSEGGGMRVRLQGQGEGAVYIKACESNE